MQHAHKIYRATESEVKAYQGGEQHEECQPRFEKVAINGNPPLFRGSSRRQSLCSSFHQDLQAAGAGQPSTLPFPPSDGRGEQPRAAGAFAASVNARGKARFRSTTIL